MTSPRPFASHGSEKMIYDIRMGPQCLHHDGTFWAVYQANPQSGKPLPHIIRRDPHGRWSAPVVLGETSHFDHHFAPVLWADAQTRFHVLYHCHVHGGGRHLVSGAGYDLENWEEAPCIAPSISYPRLLRCPDRTLVLYYRALGHMGFWTYRTSADDGLTWHGPATPHVDFDQRPELPGDEWAGSYHSVALSRDGASLHVAFVYWDERGLVNPLYERKVGFMDRYNLYYLRLHLASGAIFTIDGEPLEKPLNRKDADRCLVLDTGQHLSNMPSIFVDEHDSPGLLVPVSGEQLDDCRFWYIARKRGEWVRTPVAPTSSTWNGSHIEAAADGGITAFIVGPANATGERTYGGGPLQAWRSADRGDTWQLTADLTPEPGLLCNNPKPVENLDGSVVPRSLTCFGWPGPQAIQRDRFTGRAYLWQDGNWL
ncbi:MAG: BNR-4 repeat-containing protein [Phycisphaeraceae bacterium]